LKLGQIDKFRIDIAAQQENDRTGPPTARRPKPAGSSFWRSASFLFLATTHSRTAA
jgi:hypothetical protein